MGRRPWATYLWPGLPQIHHWGAWSAFALAVGFAVLLNGTLVVSFLWPELVPPAVRSTGWLAVGLVWFGSAAFSWMKDRRIRAGSTEAVKEATDTYSEAQHQYLRGNWFEAECLLAGLLRRNPRDLEAGLLLATLYRHNGRLEEAGGQLDRLERFEGCAKWELEIFRERQLLREARETQASQPVNLDNGEQ